MYFDATRSCAAVSSAFSFSAVAASFSFFAAAAAFAASSGGGSLATASPKLATTAPAAIRARNVVVIVSPLQICAASGYPGMRRWTRRRRAGSGPAGLDFVVPVFVVLARPFLVDVAGLHRVVRASHAEGAHVDVAEASEHEQDRARGMQHVRDLHCLPGLIEVRKVEDESGNADQDAEHDCATPEPELLARVELVRWRVAAGEQSAKALDPQPVARLREIVADESGKKENDADGEQGPDKVMQVLGQDRDP